MKIRPIRVVNNLAFVPLTKGYEAVIDAADVPLVEGRNWRAQEDRRSDRSIRAVYAMRTERPREGGKLRTVMMHRAIAGTKDGLETDHRDGNGLNNRRENLRSATVAQNQHNRKADYDSASLVKGVCWHKAARKWQVRIMADGKQRYIGTFSKLDEAAAAYEKASRETHGEFRRLNDLAKVKELLAAAGDAHVQE